MGAFKPWPEVNIVLNKLKNKFALGVATNCSIKKGNEAIELIDVKFDYHGYCRRSWFL